MIYVQEGNISLYVIHMLFNRKMYIFTWCMFICWGKCFRARIPYPSLQSISFIQSSGKLNYLSYVLPHLYHTYFSILTVVLPCRTRKKITHLLDTLSGMISTYRIMFDLSNFLGKELPYSNRNRIDGAGVVYWERSIWNWLSLMKRRIGWDED